MGYCGTTMLTNGEHDDLWRKAFKAIPSIDNSLRIANLIAIAKELHEMGQLTDEQYVENLVELTKQCKTVK